MDRLEFDNRLDAILDKWTEVEEDIKKAEYLQWQVTIPAINELRYAGRSLLRAISLSRDVSDKRYSEALILSEQYLRNAEHDIVDSIVVFIGSRSSEIDLRFGRKAVEDRNSGYSEIHSVLKECRTQIELSRKDARRRQEIYQGLKEKAIPRLVQLYDTLVASDTFMAIELQTHAAIVERLKLQRGLVINLLILLTVGLVALVVLWLWFR